MLYTLRPPACDPNHRGGSRERLRLQLVALNYQQVRVPEKPPRVTSEKKSIGRTTTVDLTRDTSGARP